MLQLRVRADVNDRALSRLHAQGFDVPLQPTPWRHRLERYSLTWITAHDEEDDRLVGFINVAWDGGVHAFLLDVVVDPEQQHAGLGTALSTKLPLLSARGCMWTSRSA